MQKISLITGGGTGIGSALAYLLAHKYKLNILIVGRTIGPLKETARLDKKIKYIQADITTEKGVSSIIQEIVNKEYSVEFLVNNAAVQNLSRLENVSTELFNSSINTNVRAPLLLTSRIYKIDRFEKKARVLMIDSSSRYNIQKSMGLYAISKAALFTMCEVMKKEFKNGLFINSLYPGTVNNTNTAIGMASSRLEDILELRAKLKTFLKKNKEVRILSPREAAEFVAWVLCETNDLVYIRPEKALKENMEVINSSQWDIRDCEVYVGCPLTSGSKLRALSRFLGE